MACINKSYLNYWILFLTIFCKVKHYFAIDQTIFSIRLSEGVYAVYADCRILCNFVAVFHMYNLSLLKICTPTTKP